MSKLTVSASRTQLWTTTALVAVSNAMALRRAPRWPLVASTVIALAGTGLISMPSQAFAQDINLGLSGDIYDISAIGNQDIDSLSGVAGTEVLLGANTLTLTQPIGTLYGGVISGSGSLIKNGSGMLILTGANTYTGNTNINAGTLAIGIGGSLSSDSRVTLNNAAKFDISAANAPQSIGSLSGTADTEVRLGANTLTVNQTDFSIYGGVISGSSGLIKNGTGLLILTGANSYTGDTVINAGSLQIGGGGTTGSVAGNIINNASLTFIRSNDISYGGVISGSGSLFKNGAGILTMTRANSYTGTTYVNEGTLAIGIGGSLSSDSNVELSSTAKFDISAANAHQSIGSLVGSAGSDVLLGANTLTVNQRTGAVYRGVISGSGSLIKAGVGTLTLTGANTYIGDTVINAGTLRIGAGDTTGSVFGNIVNNAQLTFDRSNDLSYGGVINGNGGLTKDGAGTLTLTGANTYTGETRIARGKLVLEAGGSLNIASDINLANTGVQFDVSGGNYQNIIGGLSGVAGTQVILGNNALTFGNDDILAFAGQFTSTSGPLTKTGTGTTILSGDSSGFGGRFNVYDGGLIVTSALGSVDGYIADPLLTDTNPFMTLRGSSANWAITDNLYVRGGGAAALTLESGAQVSNNFGEIGATGANAATVTVTGAGSLWTNRYALIVGTGSNSSKNGAVRILDGGKITSVDGYIAQGTSATGLIEVSGTGSSWINTGALRIGDLGGNGTLSIGDGGYVSSGLTRIGTMSYGVGIANLSGAGSRWDVTGDLEIGFGSPLNYGNGTVNLVNGALLSIGTNGTGTIQLAKDGLFPGFGTTGVLNIGAGTDNAADALAAGILQAGELRLGAGSATLRFNHTDTSYLFNTKLIGTSSTDVIKQVAGTTILTADNTGYTAQTQVSGGTLIVRGKHAGTAAVTGGALQFGDASGGQNSILNSITVSGNGSALGVYGQGTATVIGAVDLQDNTTLSIHAGTNTPALTAGNMAIGNGTAFNLSGIGSASQLPLTLISTTNGISGDFANVTIGGFNGPVDYMTLNTRKSADGLNYLADYSLSWTASNNLAHGTFTLSDATDNFKLDVALGDQVTNGAWDGKSLTKAGAGTLILSKDNTYTGGTTITGGTLQLGDGGTTGSVLGDIANSGVLAINRSDAFNLANTVFGTGSLVQAGSGTLILTGANTYRGGTTISGGTLQLGDGGTTGSITGDIFNYASLEINRFDNLSLGNTISGTGNLIKDGTNTLTLTGTNTYSGGTKLKDGTLSVSQDANLGQADGALNFKGGRLQITGTDFASTNRNITLDFNTGGLDIVEAGHSFTLNGNITGPGNVLKRGAGTLVLTGQNSFGRLRIENGKVVANSASLGNIADLAFASSALSLSDTGNGLYAGMVTGAGQLSLDGSGTVLLTGNSSTFNGTTTLNSGTLLVGNSAGQGALGGAFNVLNGTTLGGSGTIGSGAGSTVTIASGGTLSPGNSIGTLNIDGHLDLQSGSFLNMELGRPGALQNTPGTSDRVNVAGDLTLNGTLNLTQSGNAADGDFNFGYYRLMTYGGTLSGNGLTIGQSPALAGASTPQIIAGNGNVDLFVSAIGDDALQHWQGGDGVWSASNSLWLNQNGTTAANWAGNHAVFRNPDAATSGGTITLVGAQSFKGLQFVDNGYRLEGTGSLVTDSAGSEIRVLADSATIAAAITGTGSITKTQGGTLILTGNNTYSGGTTIKDGVISVTQNANLGQANGALTFDGGALQINGTALGSMDRNITLASNGGALDIVEAGHNLTLNGTITGAGTLLKQGAGTLVLTGQNSFGGISIEEGKLIAQTASLANQVDLVNASTILSLTDTVNSHYAGILSGTGQFNMDGNGTVLLTGDSSAFGGTTTLNSGTLLVGDSAGQGALGGSFNVLNGATLGGSGTIGSGAGSLVTIASGATLSPGNSIGTLNINGDLLIQKGARFVVEVTPGGTTSDLVRVSGTATLGGGTVAHIGANGHYDLRSTYTILSATSLSGTFDAVTSDFAFLTPSLTYDNSRVTLDLKRNDLEFASAAKGRNQVQTARAIESIGFNTGHAVYDTIAQMADDKTAIRSAFEQLSGELHASARAIQIEDSRFVRHAANDRLRSAFGQAGSSDAPVLAYSANGSQVAVDATHDGAAFWAQSFGSWGSFDNDANSIELERQIGGVLLGGDVRLKDWRLGVIAGYSQSEVKAERQKATSDNTTLGVYAGGQWGKLALRAGLAQSWHDIETQRSVLITGLSDYLQADYSATTHQAFVETGYALISREKQQLEAFANLAQVRASSDSFSEDGDAAALDIDQADADVTFATLGLRAARQIAMGETSGKLRATAGWRYASGDTATQNLQAFSAGDAFSITGAPIAKNAAVIETGLDVRFNANTTFGLTYTGQLSNSAQDHGFNARLSINF